MNSSIGGIDLTLETPRPGFDPRLILDLVLDHWPRAVFQDGEGSTGRPLGEVLEGTSELTTNEFFVYQDEASAQSWEQDGRTPENGNRMIHFLVRDSPSHADSLQVTMVIDDFTVEIADLYSALDGALGRPSTGPARPPRSPTLEAALRAAGCSLTRTQ